MSSAAAGWGDWVERKYRWIYIRIENRSGRFDWQGQLGFMTWLRNREGDPFLMIIPKYVSSISINSLECENDFSIIKCSQCSVSESTARLRAEILEIHNDGMWTDHYHEVLDLRLDTVHSSVVQMNEMLFIDLEQGR